MASLHYLTVQDVLWINLQLTKKVNHFSFAKLEEATYYQYAYGTSSSVIPQSARLAVGFRKLQPLEVGNDGTAFVAFLTFLKVNGVEIKLADSKAAEFFSDLDLATGPSAIEAICKQTEDGHGEANVREAISEIIRAYPKTLKSLLNLVTA